MIAISSAIDSYGQDRTRRRLRATPAPIQPRSIRDSSLADVSRYEDRPAFVEDVHELALEMPHVTVEYGSGENPVYQVGRKSFVFFRTPRPDAVDPDTGEKYPDV